MIKAENIEKSYGNLKVLKGASLYSEGAEVISIVGKSGAGKTTFLQILGTLSKPDSGTLCINGTDPFSLSSDRLAAFRNREIGFVFQFHHLLPEFTALENIMIPRMIGSRDHRKAAADAMALLEEMGLKDRADHKPGELSGGEQQRVAIARAIINSPSIVFADEPSGNLDSETKKDIHGLFLDLRDRHGLTVVIVTHDRDLAAMSDRIIEMKDGYIQI